MADEVMGSRASTLLAHEKDLSPFFTRVQGQDWPRGLPLRCQWGKRKGERRNSGRCRWVTLSPGEGDAAGGMVAWYD